jgi:hypothetical protein
MGLRNQIRFPANSGNLPRATHLGEKGCQRLTTTVNPVFSIKNGSPASVVFRTAELISSTVRSKINGADMIVAEMCQTGKLARPKRCKNLKYVCQVLPTRGGV